ncbi:MAG: DUF5916 domain-containing protein [Acidobacteriota bacterium]
MSEKRSSWVWPIVGSIAALAISPIITILTRKQIFYALALLPLTLLLWVITRLSAQDIGTRLGNLHAYILSFFYPIAVMGVTGLIVWLTGSIQANNISVTTIVTRILVLFNPITVVGALLTEEGFFRGWLWGILEKNSPKLWVRLVWTSVVFSLWHYATTIMVFSLPKAVVPVYLGNMFLIGLIFGLLRYISGSLLPPSVSHALWNSLSYTFYGYGEKTGALDIASPHLFDPERGILGSFLNLIIFVLFWRWVRTKSRNDRMQGIRIRLIFFIPLVLIGFSMPVKMGYAQNKKNTPTIVPLSTMSIKIESAIHIDGRLDEKEWEKAVVVDRFIQREPREGEPVSERTEVCIMYDDDNLYIGFRCLDREVSKIVANEMRRDIDLLNNDCIEIYLDTYHDHRSAFYFCTNPLGAQRDGIIMADVPDEGQNWDWNGVWENASSIDNAGWTAEISIPFKTLRFHKSEDIIWGINLSRYIPRKREEAFFSPILRDYGYWGKYRVSAYGHLTGIRDLRQPKKLELKPYTLTGVQSDFIESHNYDRRLNFGIDLKYHLTSNLTMDISWNTDFAQVEADQEQVNLTRFELFFPEKRDFFLEGASIFRFGERTFSPVIPASVLFFSRRIGLSEDNRPIPLLGGLKMTGKTGGFNLGFLNITAKRTSYTNDNDEYIAIPRTNFSVLRVKKDILTNSFMGFIGLNKDSLDGKDFNRGVGIDANIFLSRNAQISGFLAKTFSLEKNRNDFAAYGDFFYNDDLWTIFLSQNTIQDNFNPEMGFMPRTGIRKTQINFGISPRPKILNIRQVSFFNDFNYFAN